jgi:hypothetical protein
MTMELWELVARESVRDALASYHAAGDRGRLDQLAACFHEDGSLEVVGAEPLRGRAAIRDGLAALLVARRRSAGTHDPARPSGSSGSPGGDDQAPPAPTRVRHHLATPHFQLVTPTEIRTSTYFAVLTDIGLDHWGRYADVLTPGGGGWLLHRRVVTVEGHAPDSRFAS